MILQDFKEKHWKYEIEVNLIISMVFLEQNFEAAITRINETISKIEPKYLEEEYTAKLYMLLSTCYQNFNNINKAKQALLEAYKIVKNKQNILAYNQIIVSARLNAMTLYHNIGEYDAAIEQGLSINHLTPLPIPFRTARVEQIQQRLQ